ncbi:MAG TPA: hypothetical protein VIO38_04070 [Rariglobus sp.]
MKLRAFRHVLLSVVFAAGAACACAAAPAAPVATVFNAKTGLSAGWSTVVWGDLTFEPSKTIAKGQGGVSLLITPTALAKPYAGLQIIAGDGAGLPLNETLRTTGEVHLLLRNGDDAAGKPAADQIVQIMLAFQVDGGKPVNGQYEQVILDPAPADGKAASGWQWVKLSVAKHLKGRAPAAAPVKLQGVYVQYVEQPQASYYVGECLLINPSAK